MKLTTTAIHRINQPDVRRALAETLKVTEQSIIRYIGKNINNGPLTTMAAFLVIQQLTKLTDKEILEKVDSDPFDLLPVPIDMKGEDFLS